VNSPSGGGTGATETVTLSSPDYWGNYALGNNPCYSTVSVCGFYFALSSTPLVFLQDPNGSSFDYWSETGFGGLSSTIALYPWCEEYLVIPSSALGSTINSNNQSVWPLRLLEAKEEISYIDALELWLVSHPPYVRQSFDPL